MWMLLESVDFDQSDKVWNEVTVQRGLGAGGYKSVFCLPGILPSFSGSPNPHKACTVWVCKEETTDIVVVDASYFEPAIVAKIMRSVCECTRKGIGFSV